MNSGKQVRLRRLFSRPSGRPCSIAVDHSIDCTRGLEPVAAAGLE